jgi:translation initiation factor 2B subunit (eIF-2B alpha/beta/delta family)
VVCESAKLNVLSYFGERPELEEGFDLIPPDLITAIVTEIGVIKPIEITDLMKKMGKYVRFMMNINQEVRR